MQIDVTNELPQLNERLRGVYDHLNGDLSPLMRTIGTFVLRSTEERFETKKDPSGVSWEQLAPNTEKRKGHSQILHELGNLEDSFSMQVFQDSVVVGTDEKYGKYHQVGTKHMPARPFLGLSDDDKTDISDALDEFLEDVLNG